MRHRIKIGIVIGVGLVFVAGIACGLHSARKEDIVFRTFRSLRRAYLPPDAGIDIYGRLADVSDRTEVPCPPQTDKTLVLLTMGQSNAGNHIGRRYLGAPAVLNFYGGHCYLARDPLLGATGSAGSLWTHLGNQLAQAGADHVILVPFAIGSTSISQWNTEFRPGLQRALTELRAHYKPTYMLWQQGEDDAGRTSENDYRKQLTELIAFVRVTLPETRALVAVDSLCGPIDPAIERAQRSVVDHVTTFPGPDTDAINAFDSRSDGCHFSTLGQDQATTSWLYAIHAADVSHASSVRHVNASL